ncbi:hypothetical protein FQN53_005925 [Emmonsiellopsis sp. PD_33]|nr:hypothetical protein FQN53_005925 [Emmonsiellopsis sp. PD_33]
METAQNTAATSSFEAVQPKPCTAKLGAQSSPTVSSKPHARKPSISVAGVSKPKQSKSRNGCVTCKTKRLKCDETKPTCQQCHKRNVTCGGYKKDFKWRSFEESSFSNKSAPKRSIDSPPRAPVVPASKPVASHLSPLTPDSTNWIEENGGDQYKSPYSSLEAIASLPAPDLNPPDLFPAIFGLQDTIFDGYDCDEILHDSSYVSLSQYPKLAETTILVDDAVSRFGSPIGWLPPSIPLTPCPIELEDEDVEEISRQPNLETSITPSWDTSSDWIPAFKDVFKNSVPREPTLHPESPEMLLVRYDQRTCGILSVKDGISENPWRTLLWPLAANCQALYHAICSLSAFHCAKENPQLRVQGMDHMRHSIRALARGIDTMKTEEALGTTLALVFAESWDRHISTGIQHLRGARILLNQAVVHQHTDAQGDDIERLQFLYNTWLYTDVIARLISVEENDMDDPLPEHIATCFPYSEVHEVDPLLGCAATLFPLISRVANLIQKVRRTKTNSFPIISQAMELKTKIEEWEAPKFFRTPEDPTSNVQHSFQTAQAYRWATLLYLHQAVPEIPSESAAELAKRVLVLLATVPPSSRATVVHIYPLLVASCEVKNEEDRNWVQERWAAMQLRLMIGNIDRCLEVVREVWVRRDEFDRQNMCVQRASLATPVDTTKRRSIYGIGKIHMADNEDQFRDGSTILDPSDPEPKRTPLFMDPGELEMSKSLPSSRPMTFSAIRRGSFIPGLDDVEIEKTVRGKLHWVGVMKDWNWEGMLSTLV